MNHEVFEDLKKEKPYMCDALRELMAPEIKAEVDAAVNAAVDKEVKKAQVDLYTTKMHYTPNQISVEMNLSEEDVKKILSQIAQDKKKAKK